MLNAVVSFHFNQSDIIERLCEGRFFQENKCQGMCYLNKKVQAQDDVPFQEYAQFELESHQIIDEAEVVLFDPSNLHMALAINTNLQQLDLELILPPPRPSLFL